MKYRVLIVEDDPMARQLFSMFVEQSENYELERAIDNSDLADIYCEVGMIDLILMDIRTSNYSNGLDASERIKKKFPRIKIIVVTSMPESAYLKRAKEIGVDSFWYKEILSDEFINLMDRTMSGESIYPEASPVIKIGNATSDTFTSRELEVLRELTTGATNQAIAYKLNITARTVKAHIQHLQEKTGYGNRVELA